MPTASQQCCSALKESHYPVLPKHCGGSALKESHCPVLPGSVASVSVWHISVPVWRCAAGVPLPTTPRQCGCVLKESHCLLPKGSEAGKRKTSTAHCPKAVKQCTEGSPLPTAHCSVAGNRGLPTTHCPMQCASVLKDVSCPNAALINARPGPGGTKAWA